MWIHRYLFALIPDAADLDAATLDTKYREVTAAIVACGSVGEIRAALNIGRYMRVPALVNAGISPFWTEPFVIRSAGTLSSRQSI